jgi:tetratricopeptide (TPR) repeat protein
VDLNELERYLRIYQENPDSRVFAPLADMYRRLARYREAEQICREGLQRHPYYAGGKVALAYILLDTNRLAEAYQEIESVVTYYPDNLMARKILIRVLMGMGQVEKAQREHAALLHIAPQLAGDPELERALRTQATTAPSQNLSTPEQGLPAFEPAFEQRFSRPVEKTEVDMPMEAARKPAKPFFEDRRTLLLRKKRVLEAWIQALAKTKEPA